MLRRLSLTLILALGLLIGVASPTVACAVMAERDCCPEGSTSPCPNGPAPSDFGSSAVCCAEPAPAPATLRAAAAEEQKFVPLLDNSSSDHVIAFAWLATLHLDRSGGILEPPYLSLRRTDAALTYLRTGRLRL